MKKKSTVAMALAAAMLLPTGARALSAADFSDFPRDWSAQALTHAVENGLLTGSDGKINAYGKLTRAEMAAILNRGFGAAAAASLAGYQDVPADAWYYGDMAKAVQMGTFVGSGGRLSPASNITREEAFSALARAFALEDGRDAALSAFSDGASVSSWARGSVAALIEGRYVNGADGKISPQADITRAEFAQIMDNLVASYAVPADGAVAGNLVVRTADAALSGLTVNGDLILADGVGGAAVSLDGVTVTGRLLVRGAASVEVKDCKIEGGVVVQNPNASVRLTLSGGGVGALTVYSDTTLAGDVEELTVADTAKLTLASGAVSSLTVTAAADGASITVNQGASVSDITIDADGVQVSGAGAVERVQANGDNIAVTTPNTAVSAASDAQGVTAGGTAVGGGQTGTINDTGTGATVKDTVIDDGKTPTGSRPSGGSSSGSSSGGSSSGGSSGGGSSSGGSSSGEGSTDTSAPSFVVEAQTKVVDLGFVQYVVVTFAEGTSKGDYTLTVDGKDVTGEATHVDDSGRMVKWELTDLNPQTLVVTRVSDGRQQTITLGK